MDGTTTNEVVGLKVALWGKWTPGNPSMVCRRNALEAFSCYRVVFRLGRAEKRGFQCRVPATPAKFGVLSSTDRVLDG